MGLNFNFCIIPNPFSDNGQKIVFLSKAGENFLDKNLANTKDYQDVKEILENFGYKETALFQFESSLDDSSFESTLLEMRVFLEECGLSYSRELEVNVIKDLNNILADNESPYFNYNEINFDDEVPIPNKTKNKLIESKSELFKFKYQEPAVGERITLYFYLFLEFGFNINGKPVIQLNGNFFDSNNYDTKNYIRIVKSDFERIEDKENPNAIILRSCKTQKDFLKEIGFLYKGHFKYQQRIEKGDAILIQEKKYTYKMAEIKKFLSPEHPVVVQTNRMGYDKLIELSKKVKSESYLEEHRYILTSDIQFEAENLWNFLYDKMKALSDKEEFEEAAIMKKDIDLIEKRINKIKSIDKDEITIGQYFRLFSIA